MFANTVRRLTEITVGLRGLAVVVIWVATVFFVLALLAATLPQPAGASSFIGHTPVRMTDDGRYLPVIRKTTSARRSRHRRHGRPHYASAKDRRLLVKVPTAAGITITVDRFYAAKFQRLIAAFVAHGYRPKSIGCFAAHGHKAGSNHHWGGACDFDQRAWGKTARFMYHARALIRAAGLYDGGSFGDYGHVEAKRGLYNSPYPPRAEPTSVAAR